MNDTHGGTLLATLLKVALLRGCFSCFLNCANDTESRNASHNINLSRIHWHTTPILLSLHAISVNNCLDIILITYLAMLVNDSFKERTQGKLKGISINFFLYNFVSFPTASLTCFKNLHRDKLRIMAWPDLQQLIRDGNGIFLNSQKPKRCFPEHLNDTILRSWAVWGHVMSGPSGVQGQSPWKFSLFRHFTATKYLFCYVISSFFYCIFSVFL